MMLPGGSPADGATPMALRAAPSLARLPTAPVALPSGLLAPTASGGFGRSASAVTQLSVPSTPGGASVAPDADDEESAYESVVVATRAQRYVVDEAPAVVQLAAALRTNRVRPPLRYVSSSQGDSVVHALMFGLQPADGCRFQGRTVCVYCCACCVGCIQCSTVRGR